MSETDTGETVRFSIDFDNPPPLTEKDEAMLARLAAMRDEDIDLSDIPDHGAKEGWTRPGRLRDGIAKQAGEAAVSSPAQAVETVRLEADVLSFFRESGDASDGRINAALREYMQTQRKSA